jgi:ABC-type transport system substrate-binding protein
MWPARAGAARPAHPVLGGAPPRKNNRRARARRQRAGQSSSARTRNREFLNTNIIGGDVFWGGQAVSPVLATTYRVFPDFTFRPELISKATVTRKPFAGRKTLFGQPLPAHALQGEDFNKVWLNDLNNPKTGEPLRHQRGLRTQVGRGPSFEHIDFQTGFRGKGDPLLRNLWMRQAIGYGINRRSLVDALDTKTDIAPGLPVMNDVFITTQSRY